MTESENSNPSVPIEIPATSLKARRPRRYLNRYTAIASGALGLAASVVAVVQYVEVKRNEPSIDISGKWLIRNIVERTTHKAFEGMVLEYQVAFTQHGNRVEGIGEKWTENGQEVRGPAHTPIRINGVLSHGEIRASFEEKGRRRESSGHYVWKIGTDSRRLIGHFETTAGSCEGRSELIKRPGLSNESPVAIRPPQG